MTVDGEGKHPERRHLQAVAEAAGLAPREVDANLDRVLGATQEWADLAQTCEVGPDSLEQVHSAIAENTLRLRG